MANHISLEHEDGTTDMLFSCKTDHKGNLLETTYHDKERLKNAWAKMSENISRTVREILIQRPELIPVFAGFIEANQEEFADFLPSEKRA